MPYVIGANTAIAGYSLYQSVELIRKLGFPTIEVQNLAGVPEPLAGEFPGFRLDRIDDDEKRRIRQALKGFRHVTTHLPYTGLEYFAPGDSAKESVRTLEMAMRATAFLGRRWPCFTRSQGPE